MFIGIRINDLSHVSFERSLVKDYHFMSCRQSLTNDVETKMYFGGEAAQ